MPSTRVRRAAAQADILKTLVVPTLLKRLSHYMKTLLEDPDLMGGLTMRPAKCAVLQLREPLPDVAGLWNDTAARGVLGSAWEKAGGMRFSARSATNARAPRASYRYKYDQTYRFAMQHIQVDSWWPRFRSKPERTKVSTGDCFRHLGVIDSNGELESNLLGLLRAIGDFFDPAKFATPRGWGVVKSAPSAEGSRLCCSHTASKYTVHACNELATPPAGDPSDDDLFAAYGLVADAARLVRDFQDAIFDQTKPDSRGFKFATRIKDCAGEVCGAGVWSVAYRPL